MKFYCYSIVFIIAVFCFAIGGTTGKISGFVLSNDSKDPLPGVNISVIGTAVGTITSDQGDFVILNVLPGTYDIRFSYIGYETLIIKENIVRSDQTTSINIELKSTVIEGAEVTVIAEKPVVNKNITSSLHSMTSEEIAYMPVSNINDILSTVSGVVTKGGKLHVRGGRSNEIAFMIDGVLAQDPLTGSPGQLLSTGSIEEMVLISGTYNAEYGNAMSGIVNLVSKTGNNNHTGRMRFFAGSPGVLDKSRFSYDETKRSSSENSRAHIESEYFEDENGNSVYDRGEFFQDWNNNEQWDNDESLFNQLESSTKHNFGDWKRSDISLSGPLLKNILFYSVNMDGYTDPGWLPFAYNNSSIINNVPLGSFFGKITYQAKTGIKLFLSARSSTRAWKSYDHLWKYKPFRQAESEENTMQYILSFSYQFSPKTFTDISISNYQNKYFSGANKNWRFSYEGPYFGEIENFGASYDDPEEFAVGGYQPLWVNSAAKRNIVKLNTTSQLGKYHLVKSGITYIKNELKRISHEGMVDDFGWNFMAGEWIDQNYTYSPIEISSYLQDKIEFDNFILNIGLRLDWFDPRAKYWSSSRDVIRLGWSPLLDDLSIDASAKWQLSPRLGFSHPITDRSILHFAYGHFFQIPDYQNLYWNISNSFETVGSDTLPEAPQVFTVNNPSLGNPDLEPQKTVSMEIGWEQQIGQGTRVDVTVFHKDIQNLVASRIVPATPNPFTQFINADYANIRGFEINLDYALNQYAQLSFNYTISKAEGNSSDLFAGFYDVFNTPPLVLPKRTLILDWDQLHTASYTILFNTEKLSGRLFRNLHISLIGSFGSGLPYTPENTQGTRIGEINSERMPHTSNVDIYISRKFSFFKSYSLEIFAEIKNFTNRLNAIYVDPTTGLPDRTLFPDATIDGTNDPSNFSHPRRLQVGMEIAW
tara:strand:- start:4131 stop:6917 length:2787 start_codon:yes stop_codon:yes gene_type:complete